MALIRECERSYGLIANRFFSEIRVGEDGEVQEATIEKPYARITTACDADGARRVLTRR